MAVYTHIGEAALRAFLSDYDLGSLISFKGIAAGVENSNYLLETSSARFILTLYEKRVDPKDLPFYLSLMSHLSGNDFPCPLPVADTAGNVIKTLEGRPAAIVTFLNGYDLQSIETAHCQQLGTAMARMHEAGKDFPQTRPNDLSISGWQKLRDKCAGQLEAQFPGLEKLIDEELAALSSHWPKNLPQGAIHADLFPDNVFFLDGEFAGVIDFYFACSDALAYDLAVAANAWCFDDEHIFSPALYEALIQGYERIRPLEDHEKQALPLLCRGAALRFLLTRAHDWVFPQEGALVVAKNPLDYEKRLKHWRDQAG